MTCPSCELPFPPGLEACPRCGLDLAAGIGRRTLIGGCFEVMGLLGKGRVADVYRALDRRKDAVVAVKVLRPGLRRSAQTDESFRAQMRLAQGVHHRSVCRILDCGEHQGLLFVAMECVEGRSLKERLREKPALDADEAFDIGIQLASGLQAVHDAGLVHRDVKPQNVMIDAQGATRLMDPDLAKQWGRADSSTITSADQLFGSAEYVSPEGGRGASVDQRSDVYSLGCVLYELFTGHPPYRGSTPVATALKHLHDPIPLEGTRASHVPEPMLPVLRRALAKSPSRRHPTARALASAIALARSTSGVPARLAPRPGVASPLPVLLGALNPIDATVRLPLEGIKPSDPALRQAIPALVEALARRRARPEASREGNPLAALVSDWPPPEPMLEGAGSAREGSAVPLGQRLAQGDFAGGPGSIVILIEALRQNNGNVRAKAARALGSIGPAAKEAIPVLLDALHDHDAHVRWDAARALGQIGAAAADGLAAAVNDPDPVVRKIVADALKQIIQRKRNIQAAD